MTDPVKNLAQVATDLTDHEVMQIGKIVGELVAKYGRKANTAENLDQLRDEALTRFAEAGIIATLDPAPCFYGEPPVVEIIGKIGGDPIEKYGFDHERKQYEVIKSKDRGEDYLGQKESYNKRKDGSKKD
jgi:hypothetical protein